MGRFLLTSLLKSTILLRILEHEEEENSCSIIFGFPSSLSVSSWPSGMTGTTFHRTSIITEKKYLHFSILQNDRRWPQIRNSALSWAFEWITLHMRRCTERNNRPTSNRTRNIFLLERTAE